MLTDVSKMLVTSIIGATIALMRDAASIYETSTKLRVATIYRQPSLHLPPKEPEIYLKTEIEKAVEFLTRRRHNSMFLSG